ncbi:TonB-dependent receptor [Chryseobacterium indologenes]|uniref:TonB-dependent receptor n=1 Tax=Chryseobacterium indologenes TaxID=253 RepID=UPI000F4FD395|nr:TonB-dependent receptor [Chryseobacterium indologenes]AYZ35932.1 TonB-dependent receptor [Chryseobacterium indologenes]MBF6644716.1 TonB-dependent receptor [Chryseobacterium indologenes]MBU3050358.1 TonB-dependent receptor [Chryseobacterium indologenes]MEB4759710.1 TonB-dependent receptor [Chryseobacterium indologenes]QQQ71592.1 TonB-dependent receptor [Chryseobacterium indologenes]
MIKKIGSVFFLSSLLWVNAQEKITDIENIEFQGKFISTPYKSANQNISVISRNDIINSPAKSIDEILQQVSGMDIRRRGANGVQSDITFRGSSFEQVLLLLNGIRMNDSQTGHNNMNIPVDLDDVEKIEIIKGPAARRFGQNAYAGVINIITKPTPGKRVKISAEGGDYGTYRLGVNAQVGNEKFSNSLQANSSSSQGYMYNTDYEIRNVFYQGKMKIKNGDLRLQAGFSEKKFGANGFYSSSKATEQYEEMQASIVSLAHQQTFGKLKLNSNIYWRRGQDMYLFNRQKPEIYRNMHIGNNVGGEVNSSYQWALGTTGVGVELRKELLVSSNLGNPNRFVSQVFFEHHFSLFDKKLNISPGISWANYAKEGNFFYPGLDVGYNFTVNSKVYGNIAKVHRIPTFTELYYVSPTEVGNPDLIPENAISSEVGYQYQNNKILAKVSGFLRNSDNSIDWVKNDPSGTVWYARNVGAIKTKGIEAELNYTITNALRYTIGYTYLDSKYQKSDEYVSRYILDNLRHQLISKLETKFLNGFTNELVYRYNERVSQGSYHLLDEKLSYGKKDYSVYVLVNNLTNTKYTEAFGVKMPQRWFHIGFSYTINIK